MKREWLGAALESVGVARSVLALRRRTRTPWLTVLTYHRVSGSDSVPALDPDVVTTAETFDRQLAFLREWFDFVGIDDVRGFLRGAPRPRSPLLITFDDGYRDNHDVALPLLEKHGARAVFFVATSYVEDRRIFWWDRVNLVLEASPRVELTLEYPQPMRLRLGPDAAARAAATETVLEVIKRHYALDLPRFLVHLAEAAGVDIGPSRERQLADEHVMTWDHVRALHRAGMDVQSHTVTHRVLQTLTPQDLAAELTDSRIKLEDVLGAPVRAISYPVGRDPFYSSDLRALVQAAGYDVGFSNRAGINGWDDMDPLDVKRMTLEGLQSESHARAVLAIPYLAY